MTVTSTSAMQPTPPPRVMPPIGLGSAGIRMTPEEFDAIEEYDELYRYELIDGVLIVTPIPSEAEADPNETLGHWLRKYQDEHPDTTLDLTLSERYVHLKNSRRRADRSVWAGLGRRPDTKKDVPTITIEFVSPGKRDRYRDYIEKRQEYLGIGIKEYWVIDRFRRTMTVYTGTPDDPHERVVTENETYATDLLPGFELPLAKLLAAADQWTKES